MWWADLGPGLGLSLGPAPGPYFGGPGLGPPFHFPPRIMHLAFRLLECPDLAHRRCSGFPHGVKDTVCMFGGGLCLEKSRWIIVSKFNQCEGVESAAPKRRI